MVSRLAVRVLPPCLALASAASAWAEGQPYTYVTLPLRVPWALYFVFLILVLMPFAVMILLAWRHSLREAKKPEAE